MANVPHLRIPFTMDARGARVVEHDSRDEIAQCVYAVCSTEPGQRDELPEYGVPSQLFRNQGADVDEIRAAVTNWEDRTDALTEAEWTEILTQRVVVNA